LFVEGRCSRARATLYADRTIAFSNQQLADLLKVPQSRMVGVALDDFVADESRSTYETLLSKGQIGSGHGEVILKRSDGSRVPVFLTSNALPADCGAQIGVLFTDLTMEKYHQELAAVHEAVRKNQAELKRSRDQLAEKERQLHHISDNTAVIIAQCSRDYRYTFVNRACAEFLGQHAEEIVGRSISEVMGKEAFEAVRPYIERVLAGEHVEYEAEVPYARIGHRHMRVSYVPDFDASGNVCGWIASITDITDRKRTEEALRDSEARLSTFLEQLPIGVGAVDLEGRWTISNAVMRTFVQDVIPSLNPEEECGGRRSIRRDNFCHRRIGLAHEPCAGKQ
jgi:PAS domain S-box-containing protein